MSTSRKRPRPDELRDAAQLLRDVLKAIRREDDSPRDAMVRRRVEGAIAATELAAGEDVPRTSDVSSRDPGESHGHGQ